MVLTKMACLENMVLFLEEPAKDKVPKIQKPIIVTFKILMRSMMNMQWTLMMMKFLQQPIKLMSLDTLMETVSGCLRQRLTSMFHTQSLHYCLIQVMASAVLCCWV